jgi:hypothetical protein
MSGIRIPDTEARKLEQLWRRFAKAEKQAVIDRIAQAIENRRKEVTTYTRSRDRKLRDEALLRSEGVCTACEVDFWAIPDGLGRPVLQVHHRKHLASSNRPRITRLGDLVVPCANCHAMLHGDSKRPMAVDTSASSLSSEFLRTVLNDRRGVAHPVTRAAQSVCFAPQRVSLARKNPAENTARLTVRSSLEARYTQLRDLAGTKSDEAEHG